MHALALCAIEFHPVSIRPVFRLIQLLLADALNLSVSLASFINVLSLSMPGLLVKVLSRITPKSLLSAFLQADSFQSQQYLLQTHWLTICGQPHSSLSSSHFNIPVLYFTVLLNFLCWKIYFFVVLLCFSNENQSNYSSNIYFGSPK